MGISQYIKEIGRGPRGSKPLTREQAALYQTTIDKSLEESLAWTSASSAAGASSRCSRR